LTELLMMDGVAVTVIFAAAPAVNVMVAVPLVAPTVAVTTSLPALVDEV
jgi:hypothetical protein